jgi:hypothetical protein
MTFAGHRAFEVRDKARALGHQIIVVLHDQTIPRAGIR